MPNIPPHQFLTKLIGKEVCVFSGKIHTYIGVISAIPAALVYSKWYELPSLELLVAWIVVAMFGALLPDIDHPQSTVGRSFKSPWKHRGFTHTLPGSLFICGCAYFFVSLFLILPLSLFAFLWSGYISHLLADGTIP